MNYLLFTNWKNSHSKEMQDLTFARPRDIFIFTRFTLHSQFECENKQILFAESVEEALGYIRHIFLYDIMNDNVDDLEFDYKSPFDEKQKVAILLFNYWFQLGKISSTNINIQELKKFCKTFNRVFNSRQDYEYEIHILNGADELRKFLIMKYSEYENFDKEKLSNICSNDLFVGKLIKNFLNTLFH